MSAAIDRKLHQAAAALAAGDLARAERLSREVLERAPRHPRGLRLAAAARLQQEDGAGAGELLRLALASDPNDPQLLEGLGAAALKSGNFAEAETWLRRAMDLGHTGSAALTWLGLALSAQGRRSEAAGMFRQAAVAAPDDAGAHLNLAHELARADECDEAISSYERALRLNPDYAEALNGLGSVLLLRGGLETAATRFRQAIAARPDYAEAHDNLGNALLQMERDAEAETSIRRAIALAPGNAGYHVDLGHVFARRQQWKDALAQYEQALKLRPDFPEALNDIGSALMETGKPEAALAPIQGAINLRPDYAEAHENLGVALERLGRSDEANASFQRAIALQPQQADRYMAYGNALFMQQAWGDAATQFARALALKADLADAHYALGLVRLFRQEFDPGWQEYEWRQNISDFRKKYFRDRAAGLDIFRRLPRWHGPSERGVKEVAIWLEQGIGDQILFSTLIPDLIGTGVSSVYEVDRRLLGAYQRAFPGVVFEPFQEPPREALKRASHALLSGSLPAQFRRNRADFARQPSKLLGALPERVEYYRQQLSSLGPELKVALSWKSARKEWWVEKAKSVPLGSFASVLELPGIKFADVQYGDTDAERRAVEHETGASLLRFESVDYTNDLEEVLAILEACDLVITTSNATAHFAGALGKRTWLLYLADRPPMHYWSHAGDYRCLWYPSVEFITAPQYTEWPALIDHLKARLAASLNAVSARR